MSINKKVKNLEKFLLNNHGRKDELLKEALKKQRKNNSNNSGQGNKGKN